MKNLWSLRAMQNGEKNALCMAYLTASQRFFTCFRTQFSWFDHIFTTNSWKNIFVWFSYHIITYCITLGFLMIFWKNGHLEKKNWNPARLPEMNILNGKSTGHRPVMTVVNGNRQNSGEIYINNSKTETLHLALNFGLLNLIRIRSVLSQLL